MFEDTWLIYALQIGISYTDFWGMNPHIIKLYAKSHQKQMEEYDALLYRLGIYMCDSISVTIGNSFRAKGSKAHEYPKKPYGFEHALTQEERDAGAQKLLAQLQMMKTNFDMQKRQEERRKGEEERAKLEP